jgi:hypothetical protein
MAQTRPPFFVPPSGLIELLTGVVLRPKRLFHRFARFASVWRRTSSQAVPPDSPRRTLRARRSISAAHAASRSVFSSGAASRLSSSSTATLARSSGSSFRASSRTSLTSAMHASLSPRSVAANPALQRTRLRSPLSRQPFGDFFLMRKWQRRVIQAAAFAVLILVTGVSHAGSNEPRAEQNPGYRKYRDVKRGVQFETPHSWRPLSDGKASPWIRFGTPVPTPEANERRSPEMGDVEILVMDQALEGCIAGRQTLAVPDLDGRGVYVLTDGERVNDSKGFYIGWGDSTTICLSGGTDRSAQIHARPGFRDERGLKHLLSSFVFLSQGRGRP